MAGKWKKTIHYLANLAIKFCEFKKESNKVIVILTWTHAARPFDFEITRMISDLIIHMKKLLDSDWLREV